MGVPLLRPDEQSEIGSGEVLELWTYSKHLLLYLLAWVKRWWIGKRTWQYQTVEILSQEEEHCWEEWNRWYGITSSGFRILCTVLSAVYFYFYFAFSYGRLLDKLIPSLLPVCASMSSVLVSLLVRPFFPRADENICLLRGSWWFYEGLMHNLDFR